MHTLDTVEQALILTTKALDSIKDESNWLGTQGYWGGRDIFGIKYGIGVAISGDTPETSCYCAVGALARHSAIPKAALWSYLSVKTFNESVETVPAPMLCVLETAGDIFINSPVYTGKRKFPLGHRGDQTFLILQHVNDTMGHSAVVQLLQYTLKALQEQRIALLSQSVVAQDRELVPV